MDFNFSSNSDNNDNIHNNDNSTCKINISIQQRNGRKSWTIIDGLLSINDLKLKDFLKYLKKKLSCNGSIDKQTKTTLIIQGDHREKIIDILSENYFINKDQIVIQGF